MKIIELTEDTCDKMSSCVEDIISSAQDLLRHIKKPHPHMQDEDDEDEGTYRRNRSDMRHGYDDREEEEDYGYRQSSRRSRDRRQGYTRY